MFSKKKPEGTEDQAYDLMNLGGFGGLQRKSSPGTTEPSPNGKPFENAIKQSGRTVEQVIKEQEEDISPDFYQKDPNTFSLVANYFYEVLIKVKSNLKQGKEFEVDLDGNIPMNMLKSSTAFSKDTATSYITSTFALVAAIFISLDTRDIKDEERFSLLQLTKGVFGAIENFCNKEFGKNSSRLEELMQTVQTEEDKNRLKQDFEPIAQKYKHLDSKESDKVLVAFEQLIDIMKSEFTEVEEHKEFIAFIERQKTNPNVLKVVELVLQSYAKLGALDENGIREFLKIKDQVAHFIQSNKDLEQRKIMETVLFPIATVTAISMVHGLVEQMGLSEEHKLKLRDRFQELTEEYREIAEHEDEPNSEILKELQQLIAENPDQDPMELLVKHIGSKFDNTR
ncbi:hypothetical protein KTD15_06065 [Burkholderia multivorans]|uniref:hypothetical protein n=1 Tax=Burkholderia multivorans TaxID=87883 RepID=UPI001C2419E8|nr:hypothetical protein [Burkholderia multivorans]MBU9118358.1 hypothetical protein [Burkholderia multivorans]